MSRHINAKYDEIRNTKNRESIKKPYENGKVAKQYKGKDCKTISISSYSSISISLHSGVASGMVLQGYCNPIHEFTEVPIRHLNFNALLTLFLNSD